MPTSWFHLPRVPDVGGVADLDEREARHASGSKRLRAGDAICLFDGRGVVAHAELLDAGDRPGVVRAAVTRRETIAPPPPVHLAAALPKGDRQRVMLSMATQLGMTSFTPLACERSVARASPAFAERAGRIFVEACKQSRRAHLPEVGPALAPAEAVASARVAVLADPTGAPVADVLEAIRQEGAGGPLLLLVGPEGGFTADEVDAALARGARAASLGPAALRIETAAVALLSIAVLTAVAP